MEQNSKMSLVVTYPTGCAFARGHPHEAVLNQVSVTEAAGPERGLGLDVLQRLVGLRGPAVAKVFLRQRCQRGQWRVDGGAPCNFQCCSLKGILLDSLQ